MVTAVYPGTFDPLTRGHEDLVRRAQGICSRLVIGVADSRSKGTLFNLEERVEMAREAVSSFDNVEVAPFTGLLKDFAQRCGARIVIRGLRAVSDFEYEFQLAGMNHYLMPDVDTVFLTPTDQFQFISGTLVREIALFGGDVERFVSPSVVARLEAKRQERVARGSG
ncbi:MAG: pantetheine-phosphate adenylyltransferase [Burkholderiaceae bacterium]|jgi:pantetheine-phosphate adenylyltransferase